MVAVHPRSKGAASGNGAREHVAARPRVSAKLLLAGTQRRTKTLLSIDGGGMRGLIPARVLEEVEDAIRHAIWDNHECEAFVRRYGRLPDEVQGADDIAVDLADHFDLVSGTSTGAIVATYLATKGGFTQEHILRHDKYKQQVDAFVKCKRRAIEQQQVDATIKARKVNALPAAVAQPGSALAAQALFAAAGQQIFTRGNWMLDAALSAVFRLPALGPVLQMASMLMWRQYWNDGVDEVLQRAFGGEGFAPPSGASNQQVAEAAAAAAREGHGELAAALRGIKLSDHGDTKRGGIKGGLHTSLLIPTFQVERNRAVMFWRRHDSDPAKAFWGYSSLNRLRPPPELEVAQAAAPGAGNGNGQQEATLSYRAPPAFGGGASADVSFQLLEENDVVHCMPVDFPLWRVVRASTAAPTFFPAGTVQSIGVGHPTTPIARPPANGAARNGKAPEPFTLLEGSFVDGGVVANNPTTAGIAFVHKVLQAEPSQVAVLSLGCGAFVHSLKVGADAGGFGWVQSLIEVSMGASVEASTALGEQLFESAVAASLKNDGAPPDRSDRFLRIQAVAFAPDATMASNCLQRPAAAHNASGRAKYLAIDSSPDAPGAAHNARLAAALEAMDRPADWPALLEVGDRLAEHFRPAIRAWVEDYVLDLSH